MELSESYKVKIKIDQLKKETGMSDQAFKKLLINSYILEGEEEENIDGYMLDKIKREDGE